MEIRYGFQCFTQGPIGLSQIGFCYFGHLARICVHFSDNQMVDFRFRKFSLTDQNSQGQHSGHDDFVFFEKSSSGIEERGKSDAVNQSFHPLL